MITRFLKLHLVLFALIFMSCVAHADFVQIDTTFGPSTALLDKNSGLAWLHWNLTNNTSYNQMQVHLAPGGKFNDWRYATISEVTDMFIHYTGSPNGRVMGNDALAIRFMNDLGGPLTNVTNPQNGFHRESGTAKLDVEFDLGHAYYGYIAIDNFAGASVYPDLLGSGVDWFASETSGHWLVQQQAPASTVPEPSGIALAAIVLLVFAVRFRKG